MKRPIESDYTSLTAYTRALEKYCDGLAQPEQEPVAWMDADGNVSDNNDHKCFPIPLYTTPPAAQPEQEPVASNCTHEWIDDTKNKPQWRCVKCGKNYRREQA